MSITNLCDCSTNVLPLYQPYRCIGCVQDISTNRNLKTIERRIQNQTGVYESQYADILGAFTIATDYLDLSANPNGVARQASMVWGNKFNLRNQSDRREVSRTGVSIPKNLTGSTDYVNVPSHGNSTKSTVTGNKPGAMTPGGYGVDVKHGSYARYLGKLKGRTLALPNLGDISHNVPTYPNDPGCTYTGVKKPVCRTSMNNKMWHFSLVTTHNCRCDGISILKKN